MHICECVCSYHGCVVFVCVSGPVCMVNVCVCVCNGVCMFVNVCVCLRPCLYSDCDCLRECMHVRGCACLYCDCVLFVCETFSVCMVVALHLYVYLAMLV